MENRSPDHLFIGITILFGCLLSLVLVTYDLLTSGEEPSGNHVRMQKYSEETQELRGPLVFPRIESGVFMRPTSPLRNRKTSTAGSNPGAGGGKLTDYLDP